MLGQTRFVPGCSVPVEYAFVDSLIDHSDRRGKLLSAGGLVAGRERGTQFFDLSADAAPVLAVDLVTLKCLSNAFFC